MPGDRSREILLERPGPTLEERGVELTEEPVERPYGTDFGLRDPFGNSVRIAQLTA